ncbi:MAG: hypothetical protein EZS28_013106 [Streblomastix strix]|uniref:Uncharacterized protein n=1 Tax=Streblomastix strix TaxID=222440 RepID=A0A5J4W9M2_9EUKA|nr:MAG: hypothetical protein EZS28_013106 [Streblomastix strix]
MSIVTGSSFIKSGADKAVVLLGAGGAKPISDSLFGDLKIKFKINPNAFVFAQVNPIISMAKYYTMNKTDLMASDPDKLKNINLLFRNWSLGYQYTKKFTQMGCIADLITKISFEQITNNGLKNLICNISLVTLSIKSNVITEVTANMNGYKAADNRLQRIRELFANRPYVVTIQRVEACCNMLKKFPDMAMNTLDQQFFQMELNASNLDLLFEAIDEFEEALTTSTSTASKSLKLRTDLTSFLITLQCERNSNGALTFDRLNSQNQNVSVELRSKRPPLPILCTIYDTFLQFGPADGDSCVYDVNNIFDEIITQIYG